MRTDEFSWASHLAFGADRGLQAAPLPAVLEWEWSSTVPNGQCGSESNSVSGTSRVGIGGQIERGYPGSLGVYREVRGNELTRSRSGSNPCLHDSCVLGIAPGLDATTIQTSLPLSRDIRRSEAQSALPIV